MLWVEILLSHFTPQELESNLTFTTILFDLSLFFWDNFCIILQKKMVQNSPPKLIKSSDHLLEDYQSLNSGKSSLEHLTRVCKIYNFRSPLYIKCYIHSILCCLVVSDTNMLVRELRDGCLYGRLKRLKKGELNERLKVLDY